MGAFRDEHQRLHACRALLATGGLERFWTARGPTEEARALARANGGALTPGARALLLAAFAFWTGEANSLRFDELIGLPEAEPIAKLTTATIYGPRAVDVWLTRSDETEDFATRDVAGLHEKAASLFESARAGFAEMGDEAVNFRDAADACALGAYQTARVALCMGVPRLESDVDLHASAKRLTLRALEIVAIDARRKARAARLRRRTTPRKPD